MKHQRLRLAVYGTVQGVGFRWFVQHTAHRLDLAGYVLNRADGAVELEAEGQDGLDDLRHAVEYGPRGARVTRIEELPPTGEDLGRPFSIRHG